MTGAWVDLFDRYRHLTRATATVALGTVPLVLLYGLGLLGATPEARSGVDLISGKILSVLPVASYVGVQLAIVGILLFVAAFQRIEPFGSHLRWVLPSLAEAVVWGFVTGSIVIHTLDEIHLLSAGAGDEALSLLDYAVLSAGAGLHEEFLFRLLLIPALIRLLGASLGLDRWAAVLGAILLSSLIFSLAHHLAGEAFDGYVFAYRSVAGVFFAALFIWRGFAIAAWTHAVYDFQVLYSGA